MEAITRDSESKRSATALRWTAWTQKIDRYLREDANRSEAFDQSFLPDFLRRDAIDVDGEFRIWIIPGEQALHLVGPRLRLVKKFADVDQLENLGVALIDTACTLPNR